MSLKREISWLSFSLIVGILVGSLEVLFGKILLLVTDWRQLNFIFFLPVIGIFIYYSYDKFGGKSKEGMGLIFKVGQGENEKIPVVLIPLIMVSTWLTHLFGGSAGREGVAVQIGATLSNWLAKLKILKLNNEADFNRKSVIIGMAAGFSGLFQTPLAAVFFALEVMIIGKLEVSFLIYTGVASYTAFFISQGLGLEKASFIIETNMTLTPMIVLKLVIAGLLFSVVGTLFTLSLKKAKHYFSVWFPNGYKRIFFGGIILATLIIISHSGRYAGLGTNIITASFTGDTVYSYDFLAKLLLTVLTLAIGFQGGEVTPLFGIGSSFGVLIAPLIGLPIELVAALGYVAVFGSATNTFLAPVLIGAEVFGFEWLPYFFITMLVAYHFNFNQSIYSQQRELESFVHNKKS